MAQGGCNNGNAVLKDIYAKCISIYDVEKKQKDKVVDFVKEVMIPLMKKKDVLFDAMFQEVYHGGSYYTGLRVNNANEFDLNFILKLPIVDDSCIMFDDNKCDPGYASCYLVGSDIKRLLKPRPSKPSKTKPSTFNIPYTTEK